MAHLRRNHQKASGGTSRLFVVLVILGIFLFLLLYKGKPLIDSLLNNTSQTTPHTYDGDDGIVINPEMVSQGEEGLNYHPDRGDLPLTPENYWSMIILPFHFHRNTSKQNGQPG